MNKRFKKNQGFTLVADTDWDSSGKITKFVYTVSGYTITINPGGTTDIIKN